MENTLENKARFFAQYWGQVIHNGSSSCSSRIIYSVSEHTIIHLENSHLKLKPLYLISDEDAVEVAKLGQFHQSTIILGKQVVDGFEDNMMAGWVTDALYLSDIIIITDFLRSKSFALPYLGLSVEQQIEYGWVKLTD